MIRSAKHPADCDATYRMLVVWLVIVGTIAGCQQSPAPTKPPAPSKQTTLSSIPTTRIPVATPPSGTLAKFRMIGRESGFDFERYDDIRGQRRILEVNGGGVGLFDFDRDGLVDVFITNGCRLPLQEDDHSTRCAIFRNLGKMQFQKVTQNSGLTQSGYCQGCAVGDYDNDGFDDLYVTAYGRNALWHNNGDGTFSDSTNALESNAPSWSSSAAFADLNGDGFLDLYVVNYLNESDESPKVCPNAASPDGYEQCPPAMFDGVDDVLYLSDGSGQFIDATAISGISNLRGKGLGIVITDLDRDGRQEIFVANDGQANFLFVAEPEKIEVARPERQPVRAFKYTDRALISNVALSEAGYAQANMGIAIGDYDASGTLDLLITHFYADTTTLYSNRGGLQFEDATRSSNVGPPSRTKLGWGAAFLDIDNNGWLDLIVANGHVDDREWMKQGEPYKMRPQFFRNNERGSFTEVSAWAGGYFQQEWLGRGVAVADLNRDGKLDVVVSHQLAPSVALLNETQCDDLSLTLQLVGTSSNRDGYGVYVEVVDAKPPVTRELSGGGSYQSGSVPEIHLGIGSNRSATVKVYWPSGLTETLPDLNPGRWIIVEGSRRFSCSQRDLDF